MRINMGVNGGKMIGYNYVNLLYIYFVILSILVVLRVNGGCVVGMLVGV